jgi:hypothetical protein
MSVLLSLWLAAIPAQPAAAPLCVARVVREGLPPYDDTASRLYRLEGLGCDRLKPGAILLLHREEERRALASLEVIQVMPEYALARVATPGETFPLRGDLVLAKEALRTLPALPPLGPSPALAAGALQVPVQARTAPAAESGPPAQRETLFFRIGETQVTPGGQVKLQAWVQNWGKTRRWSLLCPPFPGEHLDLTAARITALTEELRLLGVTRVDVVPMAEATTERHPVIYLMAEPW